MMPSNPPWEPKASDIAWQAKLLESINDGGEWRVPANGTLYIFDRAAKIMWLEEGPIDYTNWQIKVTTEKTGTGWKVKRRDRADEKMTISGEAFQSKSVFTGTAFDATKLKQASDKQKEALKSQFIDALVEMGISPLRIGALEIRGGIVRGIFLQEDRVPLGELGIEGWRKEHLRPLPVPVPYWR